MSDILGTLNYVHCVPEGQNSTDKCLFIHGLDLVPQKLFQFMPKVFYRVQVRWFRRCLPPVWCFSLSGTVVHVLMCVSGHCPAWSNDDQETCLEEMAEVCCQRCLCTTEHSFFLQIYIFHTALEGWSQSRRELSQDVWPCNSKQILRFWCALFGIHVLYLLWSNFLLLA